MLKFYRWLFRWAEKQCKDHVNVDLKCPNCQMWSSAADGEKCTDTNEGYIWRCFQCGTKTHWRTDLFPFPVLYSKYSLVEISQSEGKNQ